MKSEASLQTYRHPENIKRRLTHKQRVFAALTVPMTIREISSNTGMSYNQVQKRTSDLMNEDKLIVCGWKQEHGNMNSMYCHNPNPPLFANKRLTLKEWMRQEYPEILDIYLILGK